MSSSVLLTLFVLVDRKFQKVLLLEREAKVHTHVL
jgi:hypothetical protein